MATIFLRLRIIPGATSSRSIAASGHRASSSTEKRANASRIRGQRARTTSGRKRAQNTAAASSSSSSSSPRGGRPSGDHPGTTRSIPSKMRR